MTQDKRSKAPNLMLLALVLLLLHLVTLLKELQPLAQEALLLLLLVEMQLLLGLPVHAHLHKVSTALRAVFRWLCHCVVPCVLWSVVVVPSHAQGSTEHDNHWHQLQAAGRWGLSMGLLWLCSVEYSTQLTLRTPYVAALWLLCMCMASRPHECIWPLLHTINPSDNTPAPCVCASHRARGASRLTSYCCCWHSHQRCWSW